MPSKSAVTFSFKGFLCIVYKFWYCWCNVCIYLKHFFYRGTIFQQTEKVMFWISELISAFPSLFLEPKFVYSDVIRAPPNNPDGDDDKVYFFFTEVSVEYEFFTKLLIPRIARVCKVGQQSFCLINCFSDLSLLVFCVVFFMLASFLNN